jgi:hypothetical protein
MLKVVHLLHTCFGNRDLGTNEKCVVFSGPVPEITVQMSRRMPKMGSEASFPALGLWKENRYIIYTKDVQ